MPVPYSRETSGASDLGTVSIERFDEKFIDIDTGAKVLGVRGYEGANLTALKLEDLSYVSVK